MTRKWDTFLELKAIIKGGKGKRLKERKTRV